MVLDYFRSELYTFAIFKNTARPRSIFVRFPSRAFNGCWNSKFANNTKIKQCEQRIALEWKFEAKMEFPRYEWCSLPYDKIHSSFFAFEKFHIQRRCCIVWKNCLIECLVALSLLYSSNLHFSIRLNPMLARSGFLNWKNNGRTSWRKYTRKKNI